MRSRHRRPERNFEVIAGKASVPATHSTGSPSPATAGRPPGSPASWSERACGRACPPPLSRMVTQVYGICSGGRGLALQSCWTGSTSPCVPITPSKPRPCAPGRPTLMKDSYAGATSLQVTPQGFTACAIADGLCLDPVEDARGAHQATLPTAVPEPPFRALAAVPQCQDCRSERHPQGFVPAGVS